MIRYRSARTTPGVNPPVGIESDDTRRPTLEEAVYGRRAAASTEGDARFVGSRDTEESGSPHSGQKRAASDAVDPHFGQGVKVRES
jgi:hypothetical protein